MSRTVRFLVDITIDEDEPLPATEEEAADALHEMVLALLPGEYPSWVQSFDGVDPASDEWPPG